MCWWISRLAAPNGCAVGWTCNSKEEDLTAILYIHMDAVSGWEGICGIEVDAPHDRSERPYSTEGADRENVHVCTGKKG